MVDVKVQSLTLMPLYNLSWISSLFMAELVRFCLRKNIKFKLHPVDSSCPKVSFYTRISWCNTKTDLTNHLNANHRVHISLLGSDKIYTGKSSAPHLLLAHVGELFCSAVSKGAQVMTRAPRPLQTNTASATSISGRIENWPIDPGCLLYIG